MMFSNRFCNATLLMIRTRSALDSGASRVRAKRGASTVESDYKASAADKGSRWYGEMVYGVFCLQ